MNKMIIFTDGAVPNNQSKNKNKGGVGVFFGKDDQRNISYTLTGKVTNQICELTACIMALETILSTQKITKNIIIYTDSMYIVNSMTTWAKNWEKNSWKKSDGKVILNKELIMKLYYYTINMNVKYIHVKAHTKAPAEDSEGYFLYYGNYMADKLATMAATT